MPVRTVYGGTTTEVANRIKQALIDIGISGAVSGDKYASIPLPSGLYKQYLTIEVSGVTEDYVETYVGTSDNHVDGTAPAGYSRLVSGAYIRFAGGFIFAGKGLDGIAISGTSSVSNHGTIVLGNIYDETDTIVGFLVRQYGGYNSFVRAITVSSIAPATISGLSPTATSSSKLLVSNVYVIAGSTIGRVKGLLVGNDAINLFRPSIQISSDTYVNVGSHFVKV